MSGPGQKYKVTNETIAGESEQGSQIKAVGDQLCPEGFRYMGSVAIHLYKAVFAPTVIVKTQQLLDSKVNVTEANWAVQQGAQTVARAYGWEAPATREDVLKKEE